MLHIQVQTDFPLGLLCQSVPRSKDHAEKVNKKSEGNQIVMYKLSGVLLLSSSFYVCGKEGGDTEQKRGLKWIYKIPFLNGNL